MICQLLCIDATNTMRNAHSSGLYEHAFPAGSLTLIYCCAGLQTLSPLSSGLLVSLGNHSTYWQQHARRWNMDAGLSILRHTAPQQPVPVRSQEPKPVHEGMPQCAWTY